MIAPLLVLPAVGAEVLLDVGAVVAAAEAAAVVTAAVLRNLHHRFEGARLAHPQEDEGGGLAAAVLVVPEADRRREV
jgi:hypothetical protein